ncbi:hypothetical protein CIK04_32325, partial [Vibrio sp. 03_296]|uniref:hypothetical protein n=1 Tax=Vibrio sp. 03_296 TaxID=2024409 RepID=UPI000BDD0435
SKGNTASFEATVQDGKFSTTADLTGKGLVDGAISVKADVTDSAATQRATQKARRWMRTMRIYRAST